MKPQQVKRAVGKLARKLLTRLAELDTPKAEMRPAEYWVKWNRDMRAILPHVDAEVFDGSTGLGLRWATTSHNVREIQVRNEMRVWQAVTGSCPRELQIGAAALYPLLYEFAHIRRDEFLHRRRQEEEPLLSVMREADAEARA